METPVALIQSLYERHHCIQTQLEALVELRQAESHLQAELNQIAALLACYPPSEPVEPPGQAPDEPAPPVAAPRTQEPREVPSVPPDVWSLSEAVTQLLQDFGPGGTAYVQRQINERYGKEVAHATLYDALKRGEAAGLYTYKHKQWRLAARTEAEAEAEQEGA